uniref:Uncharacterized protein n=1 Tax=Corethron hystrix TaxID=216773 RepID=A0A7S1BSN7_9STRA|mmetsp:Transcript_38585/g.89671  ORF Transcript_38585/g.89671 Transcript_38585/m.89671 type:complete len:166 (+) Transcript_38585:86-583(+)
MSRAFHPPDTLSPQDIRKISDVRREIWTAGFKGLVVGSCASYASHEIVRAGQQRKIIPSTILGKVALGRNTAALCFMVGGALGSFSMASAAGKNKIHNLHDVFEVGANPVRTQYQVIVEEAKAQEKLQHERVERIERRLRRRESLEARFDPHHQFIDESELVRKQ